MEQRTITKIDTMSFHQGFLGEGHAAAAVVDGKDFARTDPFIFLMDDRLGFKDDTPRGGAHPHAGFETVTLVLEGDGDYWKTGSLELLTAGRGIEHSETITGPTRIHILQLWLILPPAKRWAEPRWQELLNEDVPTIRTATHEIKVYSGSSAGLTSPLQNHTPFTLVDFRLASHNRITQEIPAGYNGFVYVLEGSLETGGARIEAGQSGWLEQPQTNETGIITFQTTGKEARFILYAGQPQKAPVIQYGPFIGDTENDISRLYKEYRMGKMIHMNDLPEDRKIRHTKSSVVTG